MSAVQVATQSAFAYDLAHPAALETGIDVTPVVRTRQEWDADDTGFATNLRTRPTIDLLA